jgi:hypothetical protein
MLVSCIAFDADVVAEVMRQNEIRKPDASRKVS